MIRMHPFRIFLLHWLATGCANSLFSFADVENRQGQLQQSQRRVSALQLKNNKPAPSPKVKPADKPKPPMLPPPPPKMNKVCSPRDDFQFQPTLRITLLGRPGAVTPADLTLLQHSIIQAYNKAVTCTSPLTGSFLRLQQVNIADKINASVPTSPASTQAFTVIVSTQGSCRGCKVLPFHLFTSEPPQKKSPESRQRHRGLTQAAPALSPIFQLQLQNHISSSFKTSAAGSRGGAGSYNKDGDEPDRKPPELVCKCPVPSKAHFLMDLNSYALLPKSIDKILDIMEVQVQKCPTPTSSFSSYIKLDFGVGLQDPSNVTNIQAQYQILQNAVVNAYNDVGSANTCNIQVTQAQVVPESGFGATGLNRRRRRLTNKNNLGSLTAIIFSVRGRCRGCTSSVALFNDASGRRRLVDSLHNVEEENEEKPRQSGRRQQDNEDELAERRVSGTSPDVPLRQSSLHRRIQGNSGVTPTTSSFVQAMNDQLRAPLASGNLTIVSTAQNVLQVNPVNCSTQVAFFNAAATISFSGNVTSLTSNQLSLLGQNFQRTYNSLAQQNCDPLFRTVDSVLYVGAAPAVRQRELGEESRRSLQSLSTLIILVSGRCRGCQQSTLLFNDAAARSGRLLSQNTAMDYIESHSSSSHAWQPLTPHERVLQQTTNMSQPNQCYCYSFANITTAPGLTTFFSAYNKTVAATNGTSTLVVSTVNEPMNISVTVPPTGAPISPTIAPTTKPSNRPTFATHAPSVKKAPSSFPTLSSAPTISSVPTSSSEPSLSSEPTLSLEPSLNPSVFPTLAPTVAHPTTRPTKPNSTIPSAPPS